MAKRVQEIKDGVFTDAVNELAAKPLAELQDMYNHRDIEK